MTGTTKQIFWLLALMLQSSLLFSTATVSGNLKDLTGANVSTRTFVRFRLAGCSYQAKANGVALVTPYEQDFTPAADGSISGTLYRNDIDISCLDQLDTTWYEVTVYRDGKPQKPTPYRVAAATFNLNTAAPMTTTNVPAARDAVVVNPTAVQTINGHPLAFGAGASLSATYQGAVLASGTYLRSNGSLFSPATAALIADDLVSGSNLNGVLYWPSAGTQSTLVSTPTGGAGTLCLVSTNGGAPGFSSCAGSASTAWSALSAPSANLALSMGQRTSTFSWGTGAGANTLFLFNGEGGDGNGFTLGVKGQPGASIFFAQNSAGANVFEVNNTIVQAANKIRSPAFESSTASPAATGVVRLAGADCLKFRNNADTADINGLCRNSSDQAVLGDAAGVHIAGPTLVVGTSTATITTGVPTSLTIQPMQGTSTGPFAAYRAGNGGGSNGFGGQLSVQAGQGSGTGLGGDAFIGAGVAGTSGTPSGGILTLFGGSGNLGGGNGGSALLLGGSGTAGNANGGNVIVRGGLRAGSGAGGLVQIQDPVDNTKIAQFNPSVLPTGSTAIVGVSFSGTASLDYDLSGGGITCQDLTLTVTGAADGDAVSIGIPNALASTAGVKFSAWVSASNTVTVRACDDTSGNPNPAAATVRAVVWKF